MTALAIRSPMLRVLLLATLVATGLAYVAAFVWLVRNSDDWVARKLDAEAVQAALALGRDEDAGLLTAAGGNAVGLLGVGWLMPDAEGTWTGSQGATFFLPARAAGATLVIDFAAHLIDREHPATIALSVNDRSLARWEVPMEQHRVHASIAVPADIGDGSDVLRFRFDFSRDDGSWFWHGTPSGLRAYGLKLTRLELRRADAD